jgi:hypothetical protein
MPPQNSQALHLGFPSFYSSKQKNNTHFHDRRGRDRYKLCRAHRIVIRTRCG